MWQGDEGTQIYVTPGLCFLPIYTHVPRCTHSFGKTLHKSQGLQSFLFLIKPKTMRGFPFRPASLFLDMDKSKLQSANFCSLRQSEFQLSGRANLTKQEINLFKVNVLEASWQYLGWT